jgi:hypothetical protein
MPQPPDPKEHDMSEPSGMVVDGYEVDPADLHAPNLLAEAVALFMAAPTEYDEIEGVEAPPLWLVKNQETGEPMLCHPTGYGWRADPLSEKRPDLAASITAAQPDA